MTTYGIDRSGAASPATIGEGFFSKLKLADDAGSSALGFLITIQAPDISASYTLVLPTDDGTADQVLKTDGSGNLSWAAAGTVVSGLDWDTVWTDAVHTHQADAEGGTLDHGLALTGLTDDDHTQYALLAGRSGGQTFIGGTAASNNLVLRSTSNATKGNVKLADEGGNVVLGGGASASELQLLEPSGSGTNYTALKAQAQAGNVTYTLPAADGTSGQQLTTNGSGTLSWAVAGGGFTLGTEQASTSGTTVDFTGIPAGTKNIIITLEGVSHNGTSNLLVQLGDSGGVEATGYVSSAWNGTPLGATSTAGFVVTATQAAADLTSGQVILTLKDAAGFTWVSGGLLHSTNLATTQMSSGHKSLSAELDRVRVTSVSGDTFDAGSINIAYI